MGHPTMLQVQDRGYNLSHPSHLDCWTKLTIDKFKNIFWWRLVIAVFHMSRNVFRYVPLRANLNIISNYHTLGSWSNWQIDEEEANPLQPWLSRHHPTFGETDSRIRVVIMSCTSASRVQGLWVKRNMIRIKKFWLLYRYSKPLFLLIVFNSWKWELI